MPHATGCYTSFRISSFIPDDVNDEVTLSIAKKAGATEWFTTDGGPIWIKPCKKGRPIVFTITIKNDVINVTMASSDLDVLIAQYEDDLYNPNSIDNSANFINQSV